MCVQSINQSINQSTNQSIITIQEFIMRTSLDNKAFQGAYQSINQSINQSTYVWSEWTSSSMGAASKGPTLTACSFFTASRISSVVSPATNCNSKHPRVTKQN
jgi:hypothetical protein